MASMAMKCVALSVERKQVSSCVWTSFTDAEVDGQDVQAHRLLWHGCCISLIDGMVEVVWLERMCLDVSIVHVIFLLMESCGPCTETPLTFESSWETHHACDGM